MKLILLAPPGGGKGVVSEKLVRDFGFQYISMGELLRDEVKKETEIGKKIKEVIERGDLVPDHFTVEIIRLVVKGKNHYILDGFPRTLHQAKDIKDIPIDKVIYLDVSENDVVERISGRRICEKGEHIYHIKFIRPKQNGICDVDGTKLIQRNDDQEEIVRNRLKIYKEKTKPLIEFYIQKGLLIKINGSKKPEEVYEAVKKAVE